MFKNKKVTGNLFDSASISPARFLNFCMFVLDAMTDANVDGKYDAYIAQLTTVIAAVGNEINSIDTGTLNQVGKTYEIDQLIYSFGQFMKNNSGAIGYALGSNTSPAYYQFYPNNNSMEYIRATRKTMPKLAGRVATFATTYTDSLGENLTNDLQSFLPTYTTLLSNQRQQMTKVKQSRIQRKDAFTSGQWTLTGIVHDVASLNNGNPDETGKLFPFSMLYPVRKDNRITFTASLKLSEQKELLNRTLTEKVTVAIENTALNADVLVWLAASPTATVPDTAVLVKADTKLEVKADKLGDFAGTFLMIKNASNINAASCIVKMGGLKKKNAPAPPAAAEDKALHIA